MTIYILCAVVSAFVTIYVIMPLARERPKTVFALMVVIPCSALALYMYLGAPGLSGLSAEFARSPARKKAQAMIKEEMEEIHALYKDPGNPDLILKLGGLQVAEGRFEPAIATLERGRAIAPEDRDIALQLSAAYFAQGLRYAEQRDRDKALENLKKAKAVAPADAPFAHDLDSFIEVLQRKTPPSSDSSKM